MRASLDLWHWTQAIDMLPQPPAWAQRGSTWAPSIRQVGTTYELYFAARERASGLQCIGVAYSQKATGPFTSVSRTPLVCQRDLGGSIDPDVYSALDGMSWLLWKSDGNCCDERPALWSQQLTAFGTLQGHPTELAAAQSDGQRSVIENPSMITSGSELFLLFSAGQWSNATYTSGIARCRSPVGPCTVVTQGHAFPTVPGTAGDGGASSATINGRGALIWHAWTTGQHSEGRSSWISDVDDTGGTSAQSAQNGPAAM